LPVESARASARHARPLIPQDTRARSASPFTLVDIGSRGGVDGRWRPFAGDIAVVAIEGDRSAVADAGDAAGAYRAFAWICAVLSDRPGTTTFYRTRKPGCSSIFPPNRALLDRFPEVERFDVLDVAPAESVTLDDVLRDHAIEDADFLKVDTQGSELAILRGGRAALASAVRLELEVEFLPLYEGQPLFADVDRFVRDHGFELFDLNRFYWKQRAGRDARGRGQLVFADALYLKTPDRLCADLLTRRPESGVTKVCIAAGAYGYFDYALDVLALGRARGILSAQGYDSGLAWLERHGLTRTARHAPILRGRGRAAGILQRLADALRPDSWAVADGRLGNRRK
jgi:FkbM family methyltransferase